MTNEELDAAIESAEQDVIAHAILRDIKRDEYHAEWAATREARKHWMKLIDERRDREHLKTANYWLNKAKNADDSEMETIQ